jgi:hypothetical protein
MAMCVKRENCLKYKRYKLNIFDHTARRTIIKNNRSSEGYVDYYL